MKYILGALILVLVGYSLGRYVQPARVETKIVTQIQTIEVENKHVTTTTTTTVKPDGTKVITKITQDNSVITDKSNSTTKSDTVVDNRAQWRLDLQLSPKNPEMYYFYGVNASRRIIGPVFAGVFANTDKNFGISVGMEF